MPTRASAIFSAEKMPRRSPPRAKAGQTVHNPDENLSPLPHYGAKVENSRAKVITFTPMLINIAAKVINITPKVIEIAGMLINIVANVIASVPDVNAFAPKMIAIGATVNAFAAKMITPAANMNTIAPDVPNFALTM